jgi:tetratricopeptide (TPR) repeat protein
MRSSSSELHVPLSGGNKSVEVNASGHSPLEMLTQLSQMVSDGKVSYEDHAEQIEDLSYAVCEKNDVAIATHLLIKIAAFFENLENKSEEHSRDLADVYLLIGQLYQFKGMFEESINWFRKAVVVDDQYTVSYHNIALSYIKLGEIEGAIRSLVQEVIFSPGNYYSYLILADLYESTHRFTEAEQCLKQLLERDPDNIQGLHRLIKYYRMINPEADLQLLIRRLLNVKKHFTTVEALIKVHYLCKTGKFTAAHTFLRSWEVASPREPSVHLANAYVFEKSNNIPQMNQEIGQFKNLFLNRGLEIMRLKINEFKTIIGKDSKISEIEVENFS